jgi:pimeloyl-ACP methyl ester carboxylesterase
MRIVSILLLPILLLQFGCGNKQETGSLLDARRGFQTKVSSRPGTKPAPMPPPAIFMLLQYPAAGGKFAAYLSPDTGDGVKRPAIVWITGGDCNSIDEGCWSKGSSNDEQSASEYRENGIVMMFPSLRGGNDNPGLKEGFLGEVDDVIAAADFLSKQPHVDPARIYLGGHSTGGTLVLLVSECTDRFRAVFSFGPADDVSKYPPEFIPFDRSNRREVQLRSPGYWLSSIKSPTFVFEGRSQGNLDALQRMASDSKNPAAHFFTVNGNHFSILAPINTMLAKKIVADTGPNCTLNVTQADVDQAR